MPASEIFTRLPRRHPKGRRPISRRTREVLARELARLVAGGAER